MGFLSSLGKIGSLALDFIPGGGAAKGGVKLATKLAKGAKAAGDISSVLGKQQEGKAKGAADTAGLTQAQDRNAISLYQAQQAAQNQGAQTDLERQKFTSDQQGVNAKRALLTSLLGGNLPRNSVSVAGIPQAQVGGGMLEALRNNPDALAALRNAHGQADKAQMAVPSFAGGAMVAPPKLTGLPDTGGGNSFLSTLANIGQLAGAAGSAFKGGDAPGAVQPSGGPGAVDVMGAMPGGAARPQTGQMRLPTENIDDILARLQYQANQGNG